MKLLFRQLKKQDMQKNVEYLIPFLCIFSLSIPVTKKIHNGKHHSNFNHLKYRFAEHHIITFYYPFCTISDMKRAIFKAAYCNI